MYSRLHNMCELTSCLHLPDPAMLTAAGLVKDETDLVRSADVNDQMRTDAMLSINNLMNGLWGWGDALTALTRPPPDFKQPSFAWTLTSWRRTAAKHAHAVGEPTKQRLV